MNQNIKKKYINYVFKLFKDIEKMKMNLVRELSLSDVKINVSYFYI